MSPRFAMLAAPPPAVDTEELCCRLCRASISLDAAYETHGRCWDCYQAHWDRVRKTKVEVPDGYPF